MGPDLGEIQDFGRGKRLRNRRKRRAWLSRPVTMMIAIGELRQLDRKFAFTVQLGDQAKPLEVICDSKAVAHRRIKALRASDFAWADTLREAHLH